MERPLEQTICSTVLPHLSQSTLRLIQRAPTKQTEETRGYSGLELDSGHQDLARQLGSHTEEPHGIGRVGTKTVKALS